jgi:hypothetical protein
VFWESNPTNIKSPVFRGNTAITLICQKTLRDPILPLFSLCLGQAVLNLLKLLNSSARRAHGAESARAGLGAGAGSPVMHQARLKRNLGPMASMVGTLLNGLTRDAHPFKWGSGACFLPSVIKRKGGEIENYPHCPTCQRLGRIFRGQVTSCRGVRQVILIL